MTINLKTVPPIVPGFGYARTLQGTTPAGLAGAGFVGSDAIQATISPGQGLASLFSPTVTWSNAASCQFVFSISSAQSGGLAIDVPAYYCLVEATHGGETWPIAAFYLPTLPSPGSQAAASPPDLVTLPYAAQLLAQLNLNEPQWESIPTLVTAASDAIRSWCKRRFDQATVTEDLPVVGETIRLSRIPVNYIVRLQNRPAMALSISNGTADNAWVYAATTGDLASGLTYTGLVLNWEAAGATSTSTVLFSSLTDQRISTLAAAISAVGSGWSGTADTTLGDWPLSELFDLSQGKGASPADQPFGAAAYHVYSGTITRYFPNADDGQRTGMYWVGRQLAGIAFRWGPGGEELWGVPGPNTGTVRATYNGGLATVPREVQLACVELVKQDLARLGTDLILQTETAGKYSYTLNNAMLDALPPFVRQALSRHKVTNA